VPAGELVQFTTAFGAAILGQVRLHKIEGHSAELETPAAPAFA
jgi:hypothetical protein